MPPKDGPLHWAVQRGNVMGVQKILDEARDPHALIREKGVDDFIPLHWAARRGHLEVVRVLISWGSPLDARDKFLQTPAHWAAWNGHADILHVLLQHGADANSRDTRKCTPLYNAAKIGNVQAVKALLSYKADTTLTDDKGRAPVRVACSWEYANPKHEAEIVQLLLQPPRPAILQPLPNPAARAPAAIHQTIDQGLLAQTSRAALTFSQSSSAMDHLDYTRRRSLNEGFLAATATAVGGATIVLPTSRTMAGLTTGPTPPSYPGATTAPHASVGYTSLPAQDMPGSGGGFATSSLSHGTRRDSIEGDMGLTSSPDQGATVSMAPSQSSGKALTQYDPQQGGRDLDTTASLPSPERSWPPKQYFPFELTNEDYAHRTLDLIDALVLLLFRGAANNGIIPALPPPRASNNQQLETTELLNYATEWPQDVLGPKPVFLQYLYGNQRVISNSHVFHICFDNHLDKIIVYRTATLRLLANRQRVSREMVVTLLEQAVSLATILQYDDIKNNGERLSTQFDQHYRSRAGRMKVRKLPEQPTQKKGASYGPLALVLTSPALFMEDGK